VSHTRAKGLYEVGFKFVERLNYLNNYRLHFLDAFPKYLNQDEISEILDQAKAPEWHEAMINAKIYSFEMSYEVGELRDDQDYKRSRSGYTTSR
jgi:hypothetical protein